MGLDHEVPTALRVRPSVIIRQIPGKVMRIPARGGTLLLIAVILWGLGITFVHLPWYVLAGILLIPASVLALLVELKPHGKSPLNWVYVVIRHRRRIPTLLARRLVARAQANHDRRP